MFESIFESPKIYGLLLVSNFETRRWVPLEAPWEHPGGDKWPESTSGDDSTDHTRSRVTEFDQLSVAASAPITTHVIRVAAVLISISASLRSN